MLSKTYEKHKHLIGTQINKWTVLDIVERRGKDKGYLYAKSQCDCGTIRDIRLHKLLKQEVLDCGCGRAVRKKEKTIQKYEHLIGITFYGWTILGIVPPDEKHHSTFATCKCQCGTIKDVRIAYILNGRSRDCGCGRKEMLRKTKTKNLVGQKFGKLTAVEMLDDRSSCGRIMYRCKCDCGNEISVVGNSLVTGHTLSCGCLLSYWNTHI